MFEAVSSFAAATFHKNKLQAYLVDTGRIDEAYEFARQEYAFNPRNETSLRIIASYDKAPRNLRILVLNLLIERDPNNLDFKSSAEELLTSLE